MKSIVEIPRPALRYYGGKWKLAKWIISYFPKHMSYLEPCFGAGSVLLQKRRSQIETVNDLDSNVVNFFKMLRDRSENLIKKIELTPWAKEEVEKAFEETENLIEKARRFWIRCNMISFQDDSMVFRIRKGKGKPPSNTAVISDYLYKTAKRLQGVQIEKLDAIESIKKYENKNCLIYFDPPYVKSSRTSNGKYQYEMGDSYHIKAAEVLNDYKGKVVISGYNCSLYDKLYKDWKRVDKKAVGNSQSKKIESLWLCPKTVKELNKSLLIHL